MTAVWTRRFEYAYHQGRYAQSLRTFTVYLSFIDYTVKDFVFIADELLLLDNAESISYT